MWLVDDGRMDKIIAVTGRNGRLDRVLVETYGCFHLNADICNKKELRDELYRIQPEIVINCAAYTDVDGAEFPENRSKASRVNTAGIANLRDEFDGKIIHISTDYIFNGKSGPYKEEAEPDPIGWYGHTKYAGEQMLQEYNCPGDTIVRTTVIYGGHKPDFASKVLLQLKDGKEVTLPNNLFGNPTYVYHLASGLMELAYKDKPPKILNISGSDVLSRYEFAIMLANVFGYNPDNIHPTNKIDGQAKRPRKAGLKVDLARKLNIPIYSALEGIQQLFVAKAYLYGQYPTR